MFADYREYIGAIRDQKLFNVSGLDENRTELMRPPLDGVRVIELAGIGPGPFCAMMLADHGAEVIRIDRPGGSDPVSQDESKDVLLRSRRSITLDLKNPASIEILLSLVDTADGLIEGFRPGVVERLGLGPETILERNPALVYGRMTGWGQDGPLAHLAGHDLNYLALTGCLAAIGPADQPPTPPLNLIGDYGGGGMLLAFGFTAALLAARSTGRGSVIDCNMLDGAAAMMAGIWSLRHNDLWQGARGQNLLDGGAPFYRCFECSDGKFVAVGAIENIFYGRLIEALGLLDEPLFANQHDRTKWPAMSERLEAIFRSRRREQWTVLLQDLDCCYSEVLTLDEVPQHPQNVERGSYVAVDGLNQPRPAPRFLGASTVSATMWRRDSHRNEILSELGYDRASIAALRKSGALGRDDDDDLLRTNHV